jgi:hypothetical protein
LFGPILPRLCAGSEPDVFCGQAELVPLSPHAGVFPAGITAQPVGD